MALELDYTKDSELFGITAQNYADKISSVKTTQIRKFYDEVLKLQEKAQTHDFQTEVLPFVKMLKSKVAYASHRNSGGGKLINQEFADMMIECIDGVKNKETLHIFALFFEAVIGFHKEKKRNY
ncbi:type III-A CRISPR-associated protein Csm2 [Helicobacter cetorum]|uniref:type III-A CRISPR-associated protein Csm2 n=1 Tax=Helicobacter cetorum TaxID=138563 RepID=UPI000CF0CA3C|nr:type III-A CRISPR-associated protein Csm2 [Helicobacter cetorum]